MGARYRAVFKDGELFAEYEGGVLTYLNEKYRAPQRSVLAAPMVIRDIGEYVSPLDGSHITSRSKHRDHMRAHDVVEVGNEKIGGMTAAANTTKFSVDRELGEAIKHRIDEVAAMPQAQYDNHVATQRAEHESVGALVSATPE